MFLKEFKILQDGSSVTQYDIYGNEITSEFYCALKYLEEK